MQLRGEGGRGDHHPVEEVVTVHHDASPKMDISNLSEANNGGRLSSPSEEQFQRIASPTNRVKLMKATLFEDTEDMEADDDCGEEQPPTASKSRPVILEARPTVLERREHQGLIEDIAASMLGGGANTSTSHGGLRGGLGGSFTTTDNNQSMTSSLLRSQYLSMVASMKVTASNNSPSRNTVLLDTTTSSRSKTTTNLQTNKVPKYTLQAGYDKYVALPSGMTGASAASEVDIEVKSVVPAHVDHLLPLKEAIMSSANVSVLADFGLFMSRSFRTGWAPFWHLANPGDSLSAAAAASNVGRKEASTDIYIERKEPLAQISDQILDSFESWLEVHLENCVLSFDNDVPKLEAVEGLAGLHAHAEEAERQDSIMNDLAGIKEAKQVWDLCVALWGSLRPQRPSTMIMEDNDDDDDVADLYQDLVGPDCHKTTMKRKAALTKWLEIVTSDHMRIDLEVARGLGDSKKGCLDEILALLSGNKRLEACDKAQDHGDHNAAMLISLASGPNLASGQLLQNQLERWQEGRADKFIEAKRLQMYSLISGTPVWPGI